MVANYEDRLTGLITTHNGMIEQREQLDKAITVTYGKILLLQELIAEEQSDNDTVTNDDVESKDS